jgi:hypothetical protein
MTDNLSAALGIDNFMVIISDGKEYKLAFPKLDYLVKVQERSLERYRTEAIATLKAAKELLDSQEMGKRIQEVLDQQGNWVRELMSPRGIQYFAFLCLHENHPEVDEELAGRLVSLDHIQRLAETLTDAIGMGDEEGSDSPPEVTAGSL